MDSWRTVRRLVICQGAFSTTKVQKIIETAKGFGNYFSKKEGTPKTMLRCSDYRKEGLGVLPYALLGLVESGGFEPTEDFHRNQNVYGVPHLSR